MICFSSKKTKQNPVVFIMIFVYGCNSLFCFFVSLLPTCSGGSSFFSCYLVCLHIPVVSGLSLIQFSSTFILKVSSSCAFLCYSFLLLCVCVCAESCRTEGRKRQAEKSEVRMETLPVRPVSMAVKKTRQWFSFYLFIYFYCCHTDWKIDANCLSWFSKQNISDKEKRLTADTLLAVQSGTLFVASHMYFLFYDNKHNYFHAKPNEKYI